MTVTKESDGGLGVKALKTTYWKTDMSYFFVGQVTTSEMLRWNF